MVKIFLSPKLLFSTLPGIREYRKWSTAVLQSDCRAVHYAVCQSSHSCTFLHDGWLDFLHITYHDQVPWAADAGKIKFGSVSNLSNNGYFFINFECLWYLGEECGDSVHISNNYQVSDVCKIAFGSVPNLSNYSHFFIYFVFFISHQRMGWFYSYLVH